jgi:threonine dehydratase
MTPLPIREDLNQFEDRPPLMGQSRKPVIQGETRVNGKVLPEPTINDVMAASKRLRHYLYPVIPRKSDSLSRIAGREVWLIPECHQRTGAFKFRGALNRMLLHKERGGGPVVTASSGNHAIGLTVASDTTRIESTIFVPVNISEAKLSRLRSLGANVQITGHGFDQTEDRMYEYARENHMEIVNSFDYDVVTGHGTVALDAMYHIPDMEVLLAPVASGGLIAGCSIAMKSLNPKSAAFGIQTTAWPAIHDSLLHSRLIAVDGRDTLADGLAGNAVRSELPFQIIRRNVSSVLLVEDVSLLRAIHHGLIFEHLVLEGAGAVSIAAVLDGVELPGSGPVGLVLSGGNCSEAVMKQSLCIG